jgi:hypothetical protein
MADFFRTFHHDGESAMAGEGGRVHAHPLLLYLPSRTKFQCTLQLTGQIHSPYLISTPYVPSRRHPPNFQHLQLAAPLVYKNDLPFLFPVAYRLCTSAVYSKPT